MSSVNRVFLLGRLGRDPEMKQAGQSTLAKFSLATDFKAKGETRTEWHNVVAWGKTAELVGQYLRKGSQVYIEGRLQTDSWEDRDSGKKMYRTEIVCERIQFLGGGDKSGGGARPQQRRNSPSRYDGDYLDPTASDMDDHNALVNDDVPF